MNGVSVSKIQFSKQGKENDPVCQMLFPLGFHDFDPSSLDENQVNGIPPANKNLCKVLVQFKKGNLDTLLRAPSLNHSWLMSFEIVIFSHQISTQRDYSRHSQCPTYILISLVTLTRSINQPVLSWARAKSLH